MPETDNSSKLQMLRRQELADLLGVSTWTITRWAREGDFPEPVQLGPSVLAWRELEVLAWIEARQRESASQNAKS